MTDGLQLVFKIGRQTMAAKNATKGNGRGQP